MTPAASPRQPAWTIATAPTPRSRSAGSRPRARSERRPWPSVAWPSAIDAALELAAGADRSHDGPVDLAAVCQPAGRDSPKAPPPRRLANVASRAVAEQHLRPGDAQLDSLGCRSSAHASAAASSPSRSTASPSSLAARAPAPAARPAPGPRRDAGGDQVAAVDLELDVAQLAQPVTRRDRARRARRRARPSSGCVAARSLGDLRRTHGRGQLRRQRDRRSATAATTTSRVARADRSASSHRAAAAARRRCRSPPAPPDRRRRRRSPSCSASRTSAAASARPRRQQAQLARRRQRRRRVGLVQRQLSSPPSRGPLTVASAPCATACVRAAL